MSLNSKRMRLVALTKELVNEWDQTKDAWRDAKSNEFEKKYLEELFTGVDSSLTVLDQLDKILNKIKSDCE